MNIMDRFGVPARAIALGLLFASVPAASAQELEMTTSVLDHPEGETSGNATAVALGRFSPDAIPDAAVLHGNTLHFLYAPDRRNAWAAVDGAYTSIVTLPQAAALGRDGVLASTSAGLSLLTYDVSSLDPAAL